MNIREYISTGILEAYVLGELSSHEIAEVERNLELYPELRQELRMIEETQEQLLTKLSVMPPASVKQSLFGNITAPQAGKSVQLERTENNSMWKLAVAASVAIAVISSLMAYKYWSRWRSAADELTTLTALNQRVAKDYNQINRELEELSNDVRIMDDPAFKRVIMTGTQNAPQALASVYFNSTSQEVYLRIQNLKPLAAEQQYQLWAIIDGKPVDAGVFDTIEDQLMKMKNIAGGPTNFAVTIEPRGGKSQPTLETMQVLGTVQKT